MNETSLEIEDTPAYAAHWIAAYLLAVLIALHFSALPGPSDSPATRNPSSWANR
jgi:hypothetical protein